MLFQWIVAVSYIHTFLFRMHEKDRAIIIEFASDTNDI